MFVQSEISDHTKARDELKNEKSIDSNKVYFSILYIKIYNFINKSKMVSIGSSCENLT